MPNCILSSQMENDVRCYQSYWPTRWLHLYYFPIRAILFVLTNTSCVFRFWPLHSTLNCWLLIVHTIHTSYLMQPFPLVVAHNELNDFYLLMSVKTVDWLTYEMTAHIFVIISNETGFQFMWPSYWVQGGIGKDLSFDYINIFKFSIVFKHMFACAEWFLNTQVRVPCGVTLRFEMPFCWLDSHCAFVLKWFSWKLRSISFYKLEIYEKQKLGTVHTERELTV